MTTLLSDLRLSMRTLRGSPGFTLGVIATLALGIGANTSIFSIVEAVLLRPQPYRRAERLVQVWATDERRGVRRDVASFPDFEEWRERSRSFDGLAAFTTRGVILSGEEHAEMVPALQASPGFFETLGVSPAKGRGFRREEEVPGAMRIAVLSDGLWKRRFGGRPDILGRTIRVNEETRTIVGVMPAGFRFSPDSPEQIYTPLERDPNRGHGFLRVVGRLGDSASVSSAGSELSAIARGIAEQHPGSNRGVGVSVVPLTQGLVGDAGKGLWLLLGVVALVLLIACTNVANLMLARTTTRHREMAVRVALGAGRGRILRQFLTESALLALCGGAVGLLIAIWVLPLLVALLRQNFSIPRLETAGIDASVLGFTLLLSLATALLFGAAPALAATGADPNVSLSEGGRSVTAGRGKRRFRGALVITETALALFLLAGAGTLLKALLVMRATAPGFRSDNLLVVDLFLPRAKLESESERRRFGEELLSEVKRMPGVSSAALVADLPLGGGEDSLQFGIPGKQGPQPEGAFHARFNIVSRDYFKTMGIPVLSGREFLERDSTDPAGVVTINQSAARTFWPGEDPLGRRIELPLDGGRTLGLSVVGVVGDVRQSGLGTAPQPEIFLAPMQSTPAWPWLVLVVRTVSAPEALAPAVRSVAAAIDRDVPLLGQVRSMEQVLSGSLAQPRVAAVLVGLFALLAWLLSAVGLYSVVAYSVAQRTHEIGIRMALGARPGQVLRLVIGQGMGLTLTGIAIGLSAAAAGAGLLEHAALGVGGRDPWAFCAVALLLALVALLACYLPARRAAQVDPLVSLRYE
jgi:putative ABC transport system permease protein